MAAASVACSECAVYRAELDVKEAANKTLKEHVAELEQKLQDESREKEALRERLNDKLRDNAIRIRSLEEQLQSALDRGAVSELSRAEVDGIISRDLERIHSQLVQKDMKIMELNNTVLEKERHILDLQEMCREQGELVQAKAKAFHIIQQKLLDLGSRTTREDSTETEAAYLSEAPSASSSTVQHQQKERRCQRDSTSPGHAVLHFKMGSSGSPPPVDPSEERSSITQENGTIQEDLEVDEATAGSSLQRKKQRKKVTFDLPPRKEFKNVTGQEVDDDDIAQAIIDFTTENDQLRQTIQEMESCANDAQNRVNQLQTQLEEVRRDSRNQVLKARASMQGKIRDLEDKIASISAEHAEKVEHLNGSIDTLRADREWALEENARLLKLLSSYKEKLNDSWEALDARQTECEKLRSKLDDDRALVVRLADDLEEAQQTANALLKQKISILDDVERLKEALEAQDEYIELLEADTVIYEEHIGLLRDSLGASKVEQRALIKSKAFEAKLKALEQEKEQMSRKSTDEKLHIKALSLKISSLEAENAVLIARNDELESRLAHLATDTPIANASVTSSIAAAEAVSVNPGSAFRPVHLQASTQQMANSERRASNEAIQWLEPGSIAAANVRHNRYDDEQMVNDMRSELNALRGECSVSQEKIVQMGCVNFELENQLKDIKEKLRNAEIRAQQAEQQAEETSRNCTEQQKQQQSLAAKIASELVAMEAKVNELNEELAMKNEQLEAAIIENSTRAEELKQWQFAVREMEAVHFELQTLEQQLNDEKAAIEAKWTEVRTILLEREGDMSRKTSNAESVGGGEQRSSNQIRQLMDTINDLKSTINEQNKKLERDRTERRKFKAAIRQLQADKETLQVNSVRKIGEDEEHLQQYQSKIVGLQRQRDFMDHEMTRLYALNSLKDDRIQELQTKIEKMSLEETKLPVSGRQEEDQNEAESVRIHQLQAQLETVNREKAEISNLLEKRNLEFEEMQINAQRLQMANQQMQLQLQLSAEQNQEQIAEMHANAGAQTDIQQRKQQQMKNVGIGSVDANVAFDTANLNVNAEIKAQMERLMLALQQKNTELQNVMHENEAVKMRCDELTDALHSVSGEMERRSEEKDHIIEMLQSQHTYLTQTILQTEKHQGKLERTQTVSENVNLGTGVGNLLMVHDASVNTEHVAIMQNNEAQTVTDSAHISDGFGLEKTESESVVQLIPEITQEPSSGAVLTTVRDDNAVLESENLLLRECVSESNRMQDNLTDDIKQLMVLNAELETAVEVLKGEIWSLNGQLKASLADREDLSDKLCELSQKHEEEIERARERERDLEEQKDMAEKSQRQAALAENESNRRLVEWQEKSAEMERSRLELENAYAQLTEYYQQLQQAYNALYTQVHAYEAQSNSHTVRDSNLSECNQDTAEKVRLLKNELEQRKMELDARATELQQIRDLQAEHLRAALKNIKDLREINLKLLKDFVAESVQTIRDQLREVSEEVRARAEEAIANWVKEKELKDAEIAAAIQQLLSGVLAETTFPCTDLSLLTVVSAVSKEFVEKESENAGLKKDLRDERNDKVALEMRMRQVVSERDESTMKLRELDDLLQSTQLSLTEYVTSYQQLQAKLDELGSANDRSSSAAAHPFITKAKAQMYIAAAECRTASDGGPWKCSTPCTICRELKQIKEPSPTPQLQLAILAARLTTKIADNDALFRCNAELAETNLRLQSELDELKQRIDQLSSNPRDESVASSEATLVQLCPEEVENQPYKQKPEQAEENEWTWGAEEENDLENTVRSANTRQEHSLTQQAAEITEADRIQMQDREKGLSFEEFEFSKEAVESLEKKLHAAEECNQQLREKSKTLEDNVERLEKRLEVSEEYCSELEVKVDQLEDELKRCQLEVTKQQETAEERTLEPSETNDSAELVLMRSQNEQLAGFIEKLNRELAGLRTEMESMKQLQEMEKRKDTEIKEAEEAEEEVGKPGSSWSWDSMPEQFQIPSEDRAQNFSGNEFQNSSEQIQTSMDEIVQTEYEYEEVEESRIHLLQQLKKELQEKEIHVQELEKENKSLNEELESQQRLIEGLEKKLDMTEEYSMELEVKSASLEQEITDQKKRYQDLEARENSLMEKAESEIAAKWYEELTKKNETLTALLTEKQALLDQKTEEMQEELANLQQQLTESGNVVRNLKQKLQHAARENSQLEVQIMDYNTHMDELRTVTTQMSEHDKELQQKLGETQKEVAELKQKLGEIGLQNELLKDSEQKLMDALSTSNEQLAKMASENENLNLEITNLQTEFLKAEESVRKMALSKTPSARNVSTMTEMVPEEPARSPTVMLSTNADNTNYSQMQKKMDELKQKFKETVRDKALAEERAEAMQKELTVLKKKKKQHPAHRRTSPVPSALPASSSAVVVREGSHTFNDPFEPAVQRTIEHLQQVCLEQCGGVDELGELSEKLAECGLAIHEKLQSLLRYERSSFCDGSVQTKNLEVTEVTEASVMTDPDKTMDFKSCVDVCVCAKEWSSLIATETSAVAAPDEVPRIFESKTVGVDCQETCPVDGLKQTICSEVMLDKSGSSPKVLQFLPKTAGVEKTVLTDRLAKTQLGILDDSTLVSESQNELSSVSVEAGETTVLVNSACQTESVLTRDKEVTSLEIPKKFRSTAVQTANEKILDDVCCQVEELLDIFESAELSLVTICNDTSMLPKAETEPPNCGYNIESLENTEMAKHVFNTCEKSTVSVFCQVEGMLESSDLIAENSGPLQTELRKEYAEATCQAEAVTDFLQETSTVPSDKIDGEFPELTDCGIQTEIFDDVVDVTNISYIAASLLQLQQIIRMEIERGDLKNNDYIEQFEQNISVFVAYLNRIMQKTEQNSATGSENLQEQLQMVQQEQTLSDESLLLGTDTQTLSTEVPLATAATTALLVPGYLSSFQNVSPNLHGWLMVQAEEPRQPDEQITGRVSAAVLESLGVQQPGFIGGNDDISEYSASKSDRIIISQLQNDNVRLEEELLRAHNKMECIEAELKRRMRKLQTLECDLRETKLQNCSLTRELARLKAVFSVTQSDCSATDIVKLNEKVVELEQQHAEVQSQLTDELRVAEAKLMLQMAEDSERVQKNRVEELQNSVAEWRNRYEELGRENETLQRVNGEVHNLEIAIEEMSHEKQQLYEQLCKVMEERRQLIASRDHLSTLLTKATQQNEVFEEKLQLAAEARTQNAMKIIEMESEIKKLKATLEEEAKQRQGNSPEAMRVVVANSHGVDGLLVPECSSTSAVSEGPEAELETVDFRLPKSNLHEGSSEVVPEDVESGTVQAETHDEDRNSVSERLRNAFNAIRLLEEGLRVDDDGQQSDVDIRSSVQIIAASTPSPGLTDRIHRYLRTLPHRRNAIRLYLRYLLIIYFILLHGAFLRCSML